MSRLSLFNSPLLLGFEQFEQAVDRITKSSDGYPPYDVEQLGENKLRIVLAVAGATTTQSALTARETWSIASGELASHSPVVTGR